MAKTSLALYQRPRRFDDDYTLFPSKGLNWPEYEAICIGCGHHWPEGMRFCLKEACKKAMTPTAMHDEFAHYSKAARALQLCERYSVPQDNLPWHKNMKAGRVVFILEEAEPHRETVGGVDMEAQRAATSGLNDPNARRTGVRANAAEPASATKLLHYSKRAIASGFSSHAARFLHEANYRIQMTRNNVPMYMKFADGTFVEPNVDWRSLDEAWNERFPDGGGAGLSASSVADLVTRNW